MIINKYGVYGRDTPGIYKWCGKEIVLSEDGIIRFEKESVFSGGSFDITKCVENMLRYSMCSIEEVIRMASTNPARLYGLFDRGELKQGKRADLILFEIKDNKLIIQKTFVAGEEVKKP